MSNFMTILGCILFAVVVVAIAYRYIKRSLLTEDDEEKSHKLFKFFVEIATVVLLVVFVFVRGL